MDPESIKSLETVKAMLREGPFNYLRNVRRIPGVTCPVCADPLNSGSVTCSNCANHLRYGGSLLADRTGFAIYAVKEGQSHTLMRGYKAHIPGPNHRTTVLLVAYLSGVGHLHCAGKLGGTPITAWATVPSLKDDSRIHPLRAILGEFLSYEAEIPVSATVVPTPDNIARSFKPENYTVGASIAANSHVLAIDDTWTRGGHAQSFAAALKKAGAAQVSFLSLARWIKPDYGPNRQFLEKYVRPHLFNPNLCPWTAGACP